MWNKWREKPLITSYAMIIKRKSGCCLVHRGNPAWRRGHDAREARCALANMDGGTSMRTARLLPKPRSHARPAGPSHIRSPETCRSVAAPPSRVRPVLFARSDRTHWPRLPRPRIELAVCLVERFVRIVVEASSRRNRGSRRHRRSREAFQVCFNIVFTVNRYKGRSTNVGTFPSIPVHPDINPDSKLCCF